MHPNKALVDYFLYESNGSKFLIIICLELLFSWEKLVDHEGKLFFNNCFLWNYLAFRWLQTEPNTGYPVFPVWLRIPHVFLLYLTPLPLQNPLQGFYFIAHALLGTPSSTASWSLGLANSSTMGSTAVEKTEEELRKEIDELQRQQREVISLSFCSWFASLRIGFFFFF